MSPRRRPRIPRHLPRMDVERRERESVKPLELFFDLVFVLGFTQCTALMASDPDWDGIGRGLLVLAVLWWAWVGYAWLTSLIDPEEGPIRLVMFGAMAGLLVVSLCVPEAFGDRAVTFTVAYGVVRLAHIVLYLIGSGEDDRLRRSVVGLGVSTGLAVGLLAVATQLDGGAQAAVWAVALVVDFGGPAVAGVGGWSLVPGHFAERHNLVVILALGESIVALGAGSELDLEAAVLTAAVLGVALASGFWWVYFDIVALVTARRLEMAEEGADRNRLARDSYSYLHFPMVAGIILAALALHEVLAHVHDPLHGPIAFALLGGTALYLLAHVALRWRNAGSLNRQRLILAVVLLALTPVATEVEPLVTLGGVVALLWAMIAYEHAHYGEARYALRHGLEVEVYRRGGTVPDR
jgi:low temperature requirement protein LtrA